MHQMATGSHCDTVGATNDKLPKMVLVATGLLVLHCVDTSLLPWASVVHFVASGRLSLVCDVMRMEI